MKTLEKQSDNRGFTLLELLVAMTIMLFVMSAIVTTFRSQTRSWVTQQEIANLQQNLRAGMYYLERSIRMAGYDPQRSRLFGFVSTFPAPYSGLGATTDDDDIAFTVDSNADKVIDNNANELVAYRINNQNQLQVFDISAGGIASWQTIANNITGISFTYLDSDNNVTTTLKSIRTVQITLTAQSSKSSVNSTRSLTSRVRCRNI